MRTLLPAACLLLALRLPRAAPAPGPRTPPAPPLAPEPPGLLILRAACALRDPTAFDPVRLLQVADSLGRASLIANYRLLGYNETCQATWEDSVAHATLATLGRGGVVATAGWAGARACGLLWGAGAGACGCSVPAGRAALLAALAERLAWRRAVLQLPPGGGRSAAWGRGRGAAECAASLRAARRALLANGVAVHYVTSSADRLSRDPHVVIACATAAAQAALSRSAAERAAAVLLHIPMMSNIVLDVGNSPYVRNVDYSDFALDFSVVVKNPSYFLNLTYYDKVNDSLGEAKEKPDENEVSRLRTDGFNSNKEAYVEDEPNGRDNSVREDKPPLFLVTDSLYESSKDILENILRHAILEAFEYADNTGDEHRKNHIFYLLENVDDHNLWREVVAFKTVATRQLDDEEWSVSARETNSTEWERWRGIGGGKGGARGKGAAKGPGGSVGALWAVAAAGGALAGAGAAAGAARGAARWRRARARRAAVLLAAADFTFPPDDDAARRVPGGMETMLSCWLQQLHEFGGPPPAPRPDLLAPAASAPPAPPAPPAASSSPAATSSRLAVDRCTRYKGDTVQLKPLHLPDGATHLELRRKATDFLLVLHSLRHENLNPFIGCLCETRPSLVWDYCGRGSLEDVLVADDIKLDWTFRLSLLTDAVRGLRYLHASPLRAHGRLTSRNCVVDARWVLRLTDHGLPAFARAQGLAPPTRTARDLLWTAPELLRADWPAGEGGTRGTPAGDVYSFAIIMQEVIVRGEPYCMLALSPEEIVEKLCRPPPLIRPSVSMGAAPPEAVSVMRQCWAEAPDLRPSTDSLADTFRQLHDGRKVNIIDSMFQMLEKYSNNLEELIKERTEQLDMEKKKTEQLLNRMLPRSVAERLLLGLTVEPEEFEDVSIYFSDIVGFTELAARSTPVQVVALLNDLYTTFDAAIEQYNVYKVETIGDAYMVVGGLPIRASDHAQRVATMALRLLHEAGRFRIRHLPGAPLHLRSGLHSGPVCAAVVGRTMPRYCLFGDTVNTASRMESTGAAWRVQVSASTASRLRLAGGFRLRSRGLRPVKGKGLMHTYWLLGKDGFDRALPTPPPLPPEETLMELEAESESCPFPAVSEVTAELPMTPPDKFGRTAAEKYTGRSRACGRAMSAEGAVPTRAGAGPGPGAAGALAAVDVVADSSLLPAPPRPAAPYARYRCRVRRQWSLEAPADAPPAPPAPPAPATRTGPSPPEEPPLQPSTSFG